MNCGKIIKDMKKWIHIFNDRWYCRKSGENRIDESNMYDMEKQKAKEKNI